VISSSSSSSVHLPFNSVDVSTVPMVIKSGNFQLSLHPWSAILSSVRGRRGLRCPSILLCCEGLEGFLEYIRNRFMPLDASTLRTDPRTPEVEPEWNLANTHIYNICVVLTASVDPYLVSVSRRLYFVLLDLTLIIVSIRNFIQYSGISKVQRTSLKLQNTSRLFAHLSRLARNSARGP
jgi:hypothetical protein